MKASPRFGHVNGDSLRQLTLIVETEDDCQLLNRLLHLFGTPGQWSEADRLALKVLMTYGHKREIAAGLIDEVMASFHADVNNERYVTRESLLNAIKRATELSTKSGGEEDLGPLLQVPTKVWMLVLDVFGLARMAEPKRVAA